MILEIYQWTNINRHKTLVKLFMSLMSHKGRIGPVWTEDWKQNAFYQMHL